MIKKILIIGGAGFIGLNLVKKLSSEQKNKIYIVDNFSRGKNDKELKKIIDKKNIYLIKSNILDLKINLKKFSHVFYLAATVGVKNVTRNPFKTLDANILPLFFILKKLIKIKSTCRFVFFSTSEVYNPSIKENKFIILKENTKILLNEKIMGRDSYYISKIFGEKICELSNLDIISVRPHNIYGPRMGYSHVIPEMIKKLNSKNNKINIFSPFHTRSFCYIDDAIDQIVKISFKKKLKHRIYNIGNPLEEIKMFDLAKKINLLLNKNKVLKKYTETTGSPLKRKPHMSRTFREIASFPKISLDEGLKKTINWYI
jgi:dTDP-glucose 4,6-dehydratase/UDP-glucuronate decarboxylase